MQREPNHRNVNPGLNRSPSAALPNILWPREPSSSITYSLFTRGPKLTNLPSQVPHQGGKAILGNCHRHPGGKQGAEPT